jgi:hypothetical protein
MGGCITLCYDINDKTSFGLACVLLLMPFFTYKQTLLCPRRNVLYIKSYTFALAFGTLLIMAKSLLTILEIHS